MLNRLHRLWTARLALAMALFAQGAMACSACEWLESSPDRAVAMAAAAAEAPPCHESGSSPGCLPHCLSDRQAVQKVVLDVPAMPSAPVLTLVLPSDSVIEAGIAIPPDPAAATGPPRRILLQSFQV